MKRIQKLVTTLLVLALATPAFALKREYSISQALSASAPSAVTEGVSIAGAKGWRACIQANSGQTLTNVVFDAWGYDEKLAGWVPDASANITATSHGHRNLCREFNAAVRYGRIFYRSNGTTVSGGTTVLAAITVDYE